MMISTLDLETESVKRRNFLEIINSFPFWFRDYTHKYQLIKITKIIQGNNKSVLALCTKKRPKKDESFVIHLLH